jgi:Sec-independent protein translocase protein TatA
MTTKHHAYALTEMLIIIAVLVVVMALSAKPLRMMMTEIPRSGKIYQTQNTTTTVMKQLKEDIEKSRRIVDLQDGLLTLERLDGRITYTISDGQISRQVFGNDSESTWTLPHVKVNTQLWKNNDTPYAVEITTWNQQTGTGKPQIRLKQSFVYFQKGSSPR